MTTSMRVNRWLTSIRAQGVRVRVLNGRLRFDRHTYRLLSSEDKEFISQHREQLKEAVAESEER